MANLRHDDASVRITVKGERVDTDRQKLGAVLGDGARKWINVSLNVAVKVGSGVGIKPGEAVLRDANTE